tara:strand:+ start:1501 stop:1725 length:225 start_codon:yes stop_codon:yes gene_type:complete
VQNYKDDRMNITSAKYKSRSEYDADGKVTSTSNCAIIATIDGEDYGVPLDPNNSEYAEIMKQVTDGTLTIKDAD